MHRLVCAGQHSRGLLATTSQFQKCASSYHFPYAVSLPTGLDIVGVISNIGRFGSVSADKMPQPTVPPTTYIIWPILEGGAFVAVWHHARKNSIVTFKIGSVTSSAVA